MTPTMCLFLVDPDVISMPMQKRIGTACNAMATKSFHTSPEVSCKPGKKLRQHLTYIPHKTLL